MTRLIRFFRSAPISMQGIISLLAFGLYGLTSYFLETSYVKSKFQVPYYIQQTCFDAHKIKKWYAYMLEEETFGIYIQTQFIDFAFIVAVIIAGFAIWTFIANLHKNGSFFNKVGLIMAFALPLAGGFDILENLVSFFMITSPNNFPNWLVLPYSTFAVLKFTVWGIGIVWLLISTISLVIIQLINWMRGQV